MDVFLSFVLSVISLCYYEKSYISNPNEFPIYEYVK